MSLKSVIYPAAAVLALAAAVVCLAFLAQSSGSPEGSQDRSPAPDSGARGTTRSVETTIHGAHDISERPSSVATSVASAHVPPDGSAPSQIAEWLSEFRALGEERLRGRLTAEDYGTSLTRSIDRVRSDLWSRPELLREALLLLSNLDPKDVGFRALSIALAWNSSHPPKLPDDVVLTALDVLLAAKGNGSVQTTVAAVLLSQALRSSEPNERLPLPPSKLELLLYRARADLDPKALETVLMALRPYARQHAETRSFLLGVAMAPSESAELRVAALEGLFGPDPSIAPEDAASLLRLLAASDPLPDVRSFAVTKLAQYAGPKGLVEPAPGALAILRAALYDVDARVRAEAAREIAVSASPARLEILGSVVVKDPSPEVREAALEGLYLSLFTQGESADEAFRLIKGLLRDDASDSVRVAAAKTLYPLLLRAQDEGNAIPRALEARSLLLGQPKSVRDRLLIEIAARKTQIGELYEHSEFQAFLNDLRK